jgi:peptide/nickel transport system permease protein
MSGVLSITKRIAEDRLAMFGIIIVGGLVLVAIFAPYLATHPDDVWNINPASRLQPPSLRHFLGTDRLGADIYSRILFGARITILIALIAATVSLLVGVPLGLIAGYYGSWVGDILMRGADVFLAIPQIVLAIAMAQTLGPSIPNVIIALSVTFWPWFARLAYAETRRIKNETFIEALTALGAGRFRIVILHILPNILPAIIVRTSITMGFAILTAATLGFLGLGAQPPTPEWGRMIAEAREFLPNAWWYAAAPGVAIFTVVMGFNLLGDGLRDVLDPRLRRRKASRVSAATST